MAGIAARVMGRWALGCALTLTAACSTLVGIDDLRVVDAAGPDGAPADGQADAANALDAGPDGAPADAPCDSVTFTYQSATAASVWLTGSFTSWATMPPDARPLSTTGGGIWTLTTQVGVGHQTYKFIVDGNTWVIDPTNPIHEDDGFGGQSSVLFTCGG